MTHLSETKTNKLFPSIVHLAVHLPQANATQKTCHVLASNPQIECRHTPQSRNTCPQKGGQCFILGVPQGLMKCLGWSAQYGRSTTESTGPENSLGEHLGQSHPCSSHRCRILSSGLDHCSRLLTGLPDITPSCHPELYF